MQQEHFDAQAHRLFDQARAESDRLHHEYIGTEHLLLALTRQTEGTAAVALRNLGVDVEGIRQLIDTIVRSGKAAATPGVSLPFTTRAQKTLELARKSATELGHSAAGPEHVLVGLLREAQGIAGQVLSDRGLTEAATIAELKRLQAR